MWCERQHGKEYEYVLSEAGQGTVFGQVGKESIYVFLRLRLESIPLNRVTKRSLNKK